MYADVIRAVEEAESILLLTHVNPDGDAIGSAYGFKKALESLGKTVWAVTEEPLSDYFHMFRDEFTVLGDFYEDYDLCIALDTGDLDRLGKCAELFKGETAVIDHHGTNKGYGKYNHIDGESGSCGEIIFDILSDMNVIIGPEAATGLYAALLTDTGGFIYSNTKADTHRKAAWLIGAGADYIYINKKMLEEKSYETHKATALCVDNMEFFCGGKLCVVALDNEKCVNNGITKESLNGISSITRTVSGVDTGVLITETEKGKTKVSLRSDEIVDVSEISVMFGGGGHKRAAGFVSEKLNVGELKEKLTKIITKKLEGKF